jgi:hypothetical protein
MEEQTVMGSRTDDQELFLRYLAGELGEEETSRLEQRLLFDDDFFDRMEEAQNDLLDAYAAGELSEAQRQRMESILRSNPAQNRRFRLARALQGMHPPVASQARIGGSRAGRRFLWRALVAVACAAVVAAIIFFVRARSRPKTQLVSNTGRIPSVARSGPPLSSPSQEVARPGHQPAFALLLGVSVQRGSANRAIMLPHGLRALEVQIILPQEESGTQFEVQVVFPHAAATKMVSRLVPEEAFSEKLLAFQLPATKLPSGDYSFKVYRGGGKEPALVAAYRVVIHRG